MKQLALLLDSFSYWSIVFLSLVIACVIGLIDYLLGPEISTSIFYVIPIAIASWYGNKEAGLVFTLISAIIWFVTDDLTGKEYAHFATRYWNALVRLGMFMIISLLINAFRLKLQQEEEAAATDNLTGASNSRSFHEQLHAEAARSRRFHHPLSLAFIDLDNFKQVNDTHGHLVGDQLLREVVAVMLETTRRSDLVARLGGDEFSLLFAETGKDAASTAIRNLHNRLLETMQRANWPVTFSIGLVTFETIPDDPLLMIKIADDLMYEVKKHGKNRISHTLWLTPST